MAFGIEESSGFALSQEAICARGMRISLFKLFEEFKFGFVVGHGDCYLRFRVVKITKDEGEEISRLMKCQNWR